MMKRVHTCSSHAGLKKKYKKPSMKVYELQHRPQIICSSPGADPQWWNESGAPRQF